MTTQIPHFIDGRRSSLGSTRTADVMNPSTGEVGAEVLMASAADVDTAVASAVEAQKEWAAWNPQRRARVMMKFIDLVNANTDELADLLSLEHGKTVADSKGDIKRGIEVIEFAIGIPHLMKGEFTEGAGSGIDVYSIRQPLGVVAGITPFNFPAMIPLWKAGPALACGNAFILKPSERDPSVPVRLAELFVEAGLPPGVFQVVQGDKEAVDAILEHPDIKAVGFVGSSDIAQYIYSGAAAHGKRAQCFGGAKNHMLSVYDDEQYLFQALRVGASGYLLKSISSDELVRQLEFVQGGATAIDPGMAARAADTAARMQRDEFWPGARQGLTQRESEILSLVVNGLSNRGIASKLVIGDETVKTHLRSIYRKLGVSDRTGAVATALREGIFQ